MTSYYIGNCNLSDNSINSFYIGYEEEETHKKEEETKNNISLFDTFVFNKNLLKNDNLSSSVQTFIYLNRNTISKCVRKKPQNFQHLINNAIISKYLH